MPRAEELYLTESSANLHMRALLVLFCAWLGTLPVLQAQFYTGSNQEFGKNRVQYRDFNWLYYPAEQFEVYFYQGGKELAAYTLQSVEAELPRLEALIDYALNDKLQVVVYNKQSEFRQSNIGLQDGGDYNIGGTARIIGSKIFVYYSGSHAGLDEQIRSSLARVLFSQMMYGGDWKDVIRNSTTLTMPNWFEEGLVRYASYDWTPETENFLRSGMATGKYKDFNRLSTEEAAIAGQGLWQYVADVYGENVIPNILYMARVSRNVENGFLFVLGVSLETLMAEYQDYYRSRFQEEDRGRTLLNTDPLAAGKAPKRNLGALPVKHQKKYRYSQFQLSPDGTHSAYVTHEKGQYKVWLVNVNTGKRKRLFKGDYKVARIEDKTFPKLAWHPTSQLLSWTFEKQGRAYLGQYRLDEGKTTEKELFRIDKVVDLSYADDGRRMVFAGVSEGQTDLYLYQVIGNNQQRITNDPFDDLQPRFLPGTNKIIFTSNRPDDTLRVDVPVQPIPNETDIFILDLDRPGAVLEQVTNTDAESEHHPSAYDGKNYTFLSNRGGVHNRYIAYLDSAISRIDTTIHYRYFTVARAVSNWNHSPIEYHFNSENGNYTAVLYRDGQYQFASGSMAKDVPVEVSDNPNAGPTAGSEQPATTLTFPEPDREVNPRNYVFEDEERELNYTYEKETITLGGSTTPAAPPTPEAESTDEFVLPKSRNYRLNFATDYVLTQVDNSFTNTFYQRFTGPGNVAPGLSGLMKLGASDLFEDKKIVGGIQLSGSLENNDYGISYHDLTGRVDKKITFQRRGQRQLTALSITQVNTHLLDYELKYPFNEFFSVRGSVNYRNDRTVFLSTDFQNLGRPNQFVHAAGGKVQLVFDNTLLRGLNLFNGTRGKCWAEYLTDPFEEDADTYVLGMDWRTYVPIWREIIAAFRVSGSTSFGGRKLVYYLGGVDNWLFQRVDNSTEIAQDQGYFYQALAAPMRGFWVNARNGNSFGLANAELRVPVFKTLMRKPIQSDFAENFQVVGFMDVGSAWTGLHPYSEDNGFNIQEVNAGSITVTINNNREPIVYSYGFGLRSRVLGYFVRLDWAWGVDDQQVLPRVTHLSLNLDF